MSNRLIVESKNDKVFIQALVDYINLSSKPIIQELEPSKVNLCEDDYELLSGLNTSSLKNGLQSIKAISQKEKIDKIGIILDADDSIPKKIDLINSTLKKVFPHISDVLIIKTNELKEIIFDSDQRVEIACHMVNVNQSGELENLLKEIKAQDSTYADCLEAWRICVIGKEKEVKDKEFVKFWVSNYVRFDTCSAEEKKQIEKKCSMKCFDYVMKNKSHIWNFEHSALEELKEFLKLFGGN